MKRLWWCLALCALLLAACDPTPDYVLDKERMARLMADIHTAESVVEVERRDWRGDSVKLLLKQSVYAAHGVTREQVDTSFMWYGNHLDRYLEVYDRVAEILEQRMSEIDADMADLGLAVVGDSADAWAGVRSMTLDLSQPVRLIDFSIGADDTWEPGDRYTWRMKLFNNRSPLDWMLSVEYADTTIEYARASADGEGWKELVLALDSTRTAQRVYGFAVFKLSPRERVFVDSISLVRQRVDKRAYFSSRRRITSFDYGRKSR